MCSQSIGDQATSTHSFLTIEYLICLVSILKGNEAEGVVSDDFTLC